MTTEPTHPPATESAGGGQHQTHLQPFTAGALPAEAFSYTHYMKVYGLSKADAKRMVSRFIRERVYLNDLYQVNLQQPPGSQYIHLSIKRRDKAPIHDWRDLQAIKNMIVGPEHEAVELYPADSRLVDSANQYHLWVLPTAHARFPFGFSERLVRDAGPQHPEDKSVQRPFPPTYNAEDGSHG